MARVGIKELKERTTESLLRVRDLGQPIDITLRGEVIARSVPTVARTDADRARSLAALEDLKQLAREIGARTLPPIDSSVVMRDERLASF